MMSAPPLPSMMSAPEPPVIVFATDEPVMVMPVASAEASTFWKFETLVKSPVVWSELASATVAAAFMTNVLVPVPPSIVVSDPL